MPQQHPDERAAISASFQSLATHASDVAMSAERRMMQGRRPQLIPPVDVPRTVFPERPWRRAVAALGRFDQFLELVHRRTPATA